VTQATRADYTPDLLALVRSTCLYICTKLGDLTNDFVVVGGLVPVLIISQDPPPEGDERHVGTRDLDLGFSLGIFEGARYHLIAQRFREAGFAPDVNEDGNKTFQRWKTQGTPGATVDLLIPQTSAEDTGGSVKHLEHELSAIVTPGLEFAFQDKIRVPTSGTTPLGEVAERDVWVCGPGAYIVLKALALKLRGKNKDAYDLYYYRRHNIVGNRY
jgi:hypothetical protein